MCVTVILQGCELFPFLLILHMKSPYLEGLGPQFEIDGKIPEAH